MSTYSLDFDHVDSSSTREISASQRHQLTHGLNKPTKMKEDKTKGSISRSAPRAAGKGKKKNTSGGTKRQGQSFNISTGIASFKLNFEEIDRLQNLVDEYKKEITKLKEENKTLKNVQYRNEKALRELDKEHNEFPQILESLTEEMRVLKTQNKKYVEKLNINEKQFRHLHEELMHHKDKLEKRNQSMKSRNSEHHSKLIARIRDLEESIKERDERISVM
ncbi:ciliary protein causing Leber congenital amaurosis disease-domain-containing protein [Paraphysoderma sedebokerense]|nr:ciliary protein causing Leber congenital amaurosis disease-domain-containing protein [Paraphysoderma sedebokerense]